MVNEEQYFKHSKIVINGKNKNIYKIKGSNAKFIKHCKKYISIAEFKKLTKPKKTKGGEGGENSIQANDVLRELAHPIAEINRICSYFNDDKQKEKPNANDDKQKEKPNANDDKEKEKPNDNEYTPHKDPSMAGIFY